MYVVFIVKYIMNENDAWKRLVLRWIPSESAISSESKYSFYSPVDVWRRPLVPSSSPSPAPDQPKKASCDCWRINNISDLWVKIDSERQYVVDEKTGCYKNLRTIFIANFYDEIQTLTLRVCISIIPLLPSTKKVSPKYGYASDILLTHHFKLTLSIDNNTKQR